MGDVSEDGTITGSVDVNQLDEVDPKTDEAKAQVEALKARRDEGQEQNAAEAEAQAEAAQAQDPNADLKEDDRDAQGKAADQSEQKSGEKPAEQKPQSQQQAPGTVQPPQSTAGKKPDKGAGS